MAVDRRQVGRSPGPTSQSGLADLIDRILDKGLVIDAWVRISLVGIELITIEARVVVASVDTYLKYAEAIAQTALAAEPHGETHVDQIPTDDEVAAYLNDHPEGVRSSDLEHYFGISRNEVEQIVQRLASGPRVRRDEKQRDRLLPIIQSENGRRQITDGSRQRESNKQEESEKEQEPAGNR